MHFSKGFDQWQNAKKWCGWWRNSPGTVNVVKAGYSTPNTIAAPTKNASEVMQVRSSLQSVITTATASTNGSSVAYVDLAIFSRYVWRSHIAKHSVCFCRITIVKDPTSKKQLEKPAPSAAEKVWTPAVNRAKVKTATNACTRGKRAEHKTSKSASGEWIVTRIETKEVRTESSATNIHSQRTLFQSGRLALPKTRNSRNTRL